MANIIPTSGPPLSGLPASYVFSDEYADSLYGTTPTSPTSNASAQPAPSIWDKVGSVTKDVANTLVDAGKDIFAKPLDVVEGITDAGEQDANASQIQKLQSQNTEFSNELINLKKSGKLNTFTKSRINTQLQENQDQIARLQAPSKKLIANPEVNAATQDTGGKTGWAAANSPGAVEAGLGVGFQVGLLLTPGLGEVEGASLVANLLLGKNSLGGILGATANVLDQVAAGRQVNWGSVAISFANGYAFTALMGGLSNISNPLVRVPTAVAGQAAIGSGSGAAQAAISGGNVKQGAIQGAEQGAAMGVDFEALGLATTFGGKLIKNLNPAYREQIRIDQTLKPGFEDAVKSGVDDPTIKSAIEDNLKKNPRPVEENITDAMLHRDPQDVIGNPDKYETPELANQRAGEYVVKQMDPAVQDIIYKEIKDSGMVNIDGLTKKEAIIKAITQVTGDTAETIANRSKQSVRDILPNTSHFTDSVLGFISPAVKALKSAIPKSDEMVKGDISRFKNDIWMQQGEDKVKQYENEIKATDLHQQWKEWAMKRVQSEVETRLENAIYNQKIKQAQSEPTTTGSEVLSPEEIKEAQEKGTDANTAANIAAQHPSLNYPSNNVKGTDSDVPQVIAEASKPLPDQEANLTSKIFGDMAEKQIKNFVSDKIKTLIKKVEGNLDRKQAQVNKASQANEKYFNSLSPYQRIEFMREIDNGKINEKPVKAEGESTIQYNKRADDWVRLKQQYKDRFATAKLQLQKINPTFQGLGDYFARILVKDYDADGPVTKLGKLFSGRKSVDANATFLRQRSFDDLAEALVAYKDKGIKLISDNPEIIAKAYESKVAEYTLKTAMKNELINSGLIKFFRLGQKLPPGWKVLTDPAFTTYSPGDITLKEAVDKQLFDSLNNFADSLGIRSERVAKLRGEKVGISFRGQNKVQTRFGSDLGALSHEIGHQLDERYDLKNVLLSSKTNEDELSDLAAQRHATTTDVKPSFKKYVQTPSEKIAAFVNAYINTPDLAKEIAPETTKAFDDFISSHPELSTIKDIKPSIELQMNEQKFSVGGPVLRGHYYGAPGTEILNNYYTDNPDWAKAVTSVTRRAETAILGVKLAFSAYHLPRGIGEAASGKMEMVANDIMGVINNTAHGDFPRVIKAIADIPVQIAKLPLSPIRDSLAARKFYSWYSGSDSDNANLDPTSKKIFQDIVDAAPGRSPADRVTKNYLNDLRTAIVNRKPIQAAAPVVRLIMSSGYLISDHYAEGLKFQYVVDRIRNEALNNPNFHSGNSDTDSTITQQIVHEADQKFLQMQADHVFWNKTLSDMGQIAFLSIRAAYSDVSRGLGSMKDIFSTTLFGKDGIPKGKINLTPRTLSTLGSTFTWLMIGGAMSYLSGNPPQSIWDYTDPKDSEGVRHKLPWFGSSAIAFAHNPGEESSARLNPLLTSIDQQLNNKNYFGQTINPDVSSSSPGDLFNMLNVQDPLVPQIEDIWKNSLFVNLEPIGLQSPYGEQETVGEHIEQSLGFTRAPYWIQNQGQQ